jgi:hypothetical protein
MGRSRSFARWTPESIDAECKAAHESYADDLRRRHLDYFAARPSQRSMKHLFAAATRPDCFPEGWSRLADALPETAWHRHHLSGGSSQTLAVALLSAGRRADPTLSWLPGAEALGRDHVSLFEAVLAPHVLNEHPRQTNVDWLVVGREGVIAAEAKLTERGFGTCSCEGRADGRCSRRVLARPYWRVAERSLEIRRFPESRHCPLGTAYQAVRNVAAAQAIAGQDRSAAFLVLYDERNPYFTGAGRWPGWIAILEGLMTYSTMRFGALSWQSLLRTTPVEPRVREWARAKHGL